MTGGRGLMVGCYCCIKTSFWKLLEKCAGLEECLRSKEGVSCIPRGKGA